MRLIDADKLIEDLYLNAYACTNDEVNKILHKQLESNIEVINNQPTAYDVDKVVKELERKSKIHNIVGESKNDIVNIYASACYDEAIEIVKAGGLDD